MPIRQMRLAPAATDDVSSALAALRAEVGLPAMFPQDVLEEARAAAERDFTAGRADHRGIEFITIDPPGSKDLDQAVHVEQSGEGYVVHYAIADVGAFVTPGGALDAEVRKRGMTVYGPDARTPLHPKILSEGAASLLPEEDRPAVLWTIALDLRGTITGASLERALVRSRERLTYAEVQSSLDAGTASETLQLLADVGRLRQSLEVARGGVSLQVPEQEVERREDGTFTVDFRRNLPVEEWNAQISLLTGIVAARMMREAGVGVLRTLPEADPRDLASLHRTARALRIDWPDDVPYARLIPNLESRIPEHAAFLNEATMLFRGAGYAAFGMKGADGVVVQPPENTRHAAIAADYAHVTAPLRRLVDRYATEVCLAVSTGTPVPGWVLEAMPDLPAVMAETGQRASSFERECVNIVEASLLADRIGDEFDGVVVDVDDQDRGRQRGQVVLRDPAVRARVEGADLPLGDEVRVKLAEADVAGRKVTFVLPGGRTPGGPTHAPASSRSGRAQHSGTGQAPAPASTQSPGQEPAPAKDSDPEQRPDPEQRAGRRAAGGRRSSGTVGRRAAAPAPFALPADGPLPAHGTVVESRPESASRPDSAPRPEIAPRPDSVQRPSAQPWTNPAAPEAAAPPRRASAPQPAPRPVAAPSAVQHPGHGLSHPTVRRPVRPQVRDEVPLSESWPRRPQAVLPPRRALPMSQPVPVIRVGGLPDAGHVAEHRAATSLELPAVAAADLLAVEGQAPDTYRF